MLVCTISFDICASAGSFPGGGLEGVVHLSWNKLFFVKRMRKKVPGQAGRHDFSPPSPLTGRFTSIFCRHTLPAFARERMRVHLRMG